MPRKQYTQAEAASILGSLTLDDLEAALGELTRERLVRERCYPKWVGEGKMSRIDAKDRLSRIISAEEFLNLLIDKLPPPA